MIRKAVSATSAHQPPGTALPAASSSRAIARSTRSVSGTPGW